MIRFHKKPILVPIGQPTYIRREASGKHNEVTVIVSRYAIPLNNVFYSGANSLNKSIIIAGLKATKSFQDIEFAFNNNPQAPAFTFVVKAKTERRGDDIHNQELADKIVRIKANMKAGVVARKVFLAIATHYSNELSFNHSVFEALCGYEFRETSYLNNIWSESK
jgi:hypothetical protein